MKKSKLITTVLMSGLCAQPAHCMLTRSCTNVNKLKTRQLPSSKQIQTRRWHITGIRTTPRYPIRTYDEILLEIFADYPYLNNLEDGPLRTQCTITAEKINLQEEHIRTIAETIQKSLSLEHELFKLSLEGKNTAKTEQMIVTNKDYRTRLKKFLNNFEQIDEDKEALTLLNNGLKNASHHGTRVFTTVPQLIAHMIKNPKNISLANCFAHYPGSMAFFTTFAAELIPIYKSEILIDMFQQSDFFVLGSFIYLALPIAATLLLSNKMSYHRAVEHILLSTYSCTQENVSPTLDSISSHIKEKELQKYATTIEKLASQNQSSLNRPKTTESHVANFLKKLKKITAKE